MRFHMNNITKSILVALAFVAGSFSSGWATVATVSEKGLLLLDAAYKGDRATVQRLIDDGVNVNSHNKFGQSPLCITRDTEIARMLIDAHADINHQDKYRLTALIYASENGRTEIVRMLIDAGADVNYQEYTWKQTALINASWNGRTEIVRMLIDAGADVNTEDQWGRTPLDLAIEGGNIEIVKLLKNHQEWLKLIHSNCVAEEWPDCPLGVIKDRIMPFLVPNQQ
jgi:uncharacterized protein